MPDRSRPALRPMTQGDLDAVLKIELQCYPHPWTKGIFGDCIRVGYDCWVLEDEETGIIGYGVLSIGAGESHVLNLAVDPSLRGQGLGRYLLEHLLQRARSGGAEMALLEVRPSNAGARALYEKIGFNEIGRRPDYYPDGDGREDALLYALYLDPGEAAP